MASRSLTDTESRYSNIERECLAVIFGMEKFEYYLLGRRTLVETGHSPLEEFSRRTLQKPQPGCKDCCSDVFSLTLMSDTDEKTQFLLLMHCHMCTVAFPFSPDGQRKS